MRHEQKRAPSVSLRPGSSRVIFQTWGDKTPPNVPNPEKVREAQKYHVSGLSSPPLLGLPLLLLVHRSVLGALVFKWSDGCITRPDSGRRSNQALPTRASAHGPLSQRTGLDHLGIRKATKRRKPLLSSHSRRRCQLPTFQKWPGFPSCLTVSLNDLESQHERVVCAERPLDGSSASRLHSAARIRDGGRERIFLAHCRV